MKDKKYYAYFLLGKEGLPANRRGICESWVECENLVKGKDARYRGFKTRGEAQAWLDAGAQYEVKQKPKKKLTAGIYFDAGTGRGEGVEVSVTDSKGNDLLKDILPKKLLNIHGKHLIKENVTNNYGELLACKYALELALRQKTKKVFGDSKLVIDFWSKGIINRKLMPKKTIELAEEVTDLREQFENIGGKVGRVSGDHNPADLGFHR